MTRQATVRNMKEPVISRIVWAPMYMPARFVMAVLLLWYAKAAAEVEIVLPVAAPEYNK